MEEDGLRCPYHGWKFGTDGACLEMPFEPKGTPWTALAEGERVQFRPTEHERGLRAEGVRVVAKS